MKYLIAVVLSTFIIATGCSNIEEELNRDVYEAFKNLIHLEPKEICQRDCDDWVAMGGDITHLTEWRGQRSITATGFYQPGNVRGASWTTIRLNEDDQRASLRVYFWTGNNSPVEDVYYIDFTNNPWRFFQTDDSGHYTIGYGVGFYGDESREGTKNYRISITHYPEENYVTMMAYGGGSSNWQVGARYYFKDKEMTKQVIDNLQTTVSKLRNYQDTSIFGKLFYSN